MCSMEHVPVLHVPETHLISFQELSSAVVTVALHCLAPLTDVYVCTCSCCTSFNRFSIAVDPLHIMPWFIHLHGNGCYVPYWCTKVYTHT